LRPHCHRLLCIRCRRPWWNWWSWLLCKYSWATFIYC